MKDHGLSQWEIITKLRKYSDEIKKRLFSRTNGPNSTKLRTKHPRLKGTQALTNKKITVFFSFSESTLWFNHSFLRKCFYGLKPISHVSDVAHEYLVRTFF